MLSIVQKIKVSFKLPIFYINIMSTPKVSIIMATYNGEKTLAKSLDSIIAQTFTDWEFVICDDCSTDCTNKILQEYAGKDTRFKILRNETNSKLAYSLNKCLENCSGEYIARMDDDDESLPQRLETQVKFLQEHSEYVVVGSAALISDGNKILGKRIPKEYPTQNDVLRGPTFMHPTIMMRKCAYDKLDGYTVSSRTQRGQDWDLWFKFYAAGMKGYNIQDPLYIYRENSAAYKKRTLRTALMYSSTAFHGFQAIKAPFYKYILILKPIIAALTPRAALNWIHIKK